MTVIIPAAQNLKTTFGSLAFDADQGKDFVTILAEMWPDWDAASVPDSLPEPTLSAPPPAGDQPPVASPETVTLPVPGMAEGTVTPPSPLPLRVAEVPRPEMSALPGPPSLHPRQDNGGTSRSAPVPDRNGGPVPMPWPPDGPAPVAHLPAPLPPLSGQGGGVEPVGVTLLQGAQLPPQAKAAAASSHPGPPSERHESRSADHLPRLPVGAAPAGKMLLPDRIPSPPPSAAPRISNGASPLGMAMPAAVPAEEPAAKPAAVLGRTAPPTPTAMPLPMRTDSPEAGDAAPLPAAADVPMPSPSAPDTAPPPPRPAVTAAPAATPFPPGPATAGDAPPRPVEATAHLSGGSKVPDARPFLAEVLSPAATPVPDAALHAATPEAAPSALPQNVSDIAENPEDRAPSPRAGLPPTLIPDLLRITAAAPDRPIRVTLAPEDLGSLQFTMTRTPDGMHIHLAVDQPATLDLLRRHADQLLADLRSAGFADATLGFSGGETGDGARGGSRALPLAAPDAAASAAAETPAPAQVAPGSLNLRL